MQERNNIEDKLVQFHYNWSRFDSFMRDYTVYLNGYNSAHLLFSKEPNPGKRIGYSQTMDDQEQKAQAALNEALACFKNLQEALACPVAPVVAKAKPKKKPATAKK